jgi:peroxiredoxin
MPLLKSNSGEIGSAIIDFTLKGVDEKIYSVSSFSSKNILVIIFMCNHCPYVQAIVERLVILQTKYESKSVQLIGINSNDTESYPEDSYKNMKSFSKERKFNFPYLIDENQSTAKSYDAVCTPDIYVYDKSRQLKYRGRLDDNWQEIENVKTRDLESAIDSILADKEITFEQIPSMGCSIKWKNKN